MGQISDNVVSAYARFIQVGDVYDHNDFFPGLGSCSSGASSCNRIWLLLLNEPVAGLVNTGLGGAFTEEFGSVVNRYVVL